MSKTSSASTLTGQATAVDNPEEILSVVPQDAVAWINSQAHYTLPTRIQKQLTVGYLAHYFSPWEGDNALHTPAEIKDLIQTIINSYLEARGVGANGQLHTQTWIESIAANADLDHFPNLIKKAITIDDADVRLLPTVEPSFTEWLSENNGYPFDNLQNSFIAANTPIAVWHSSKDGAWYLISSAGFPGWIRSKAIAFVSSGFIKRWKTREYLTPLKPYSSSSGIALPPLNARMGHIYPLQKRLAKSYDVTAAVSNSNHLAVAKTVRISKPCFNRFPLELTLTNLAQVVNTLIGQPYGWGGMYGYRDCSSTLLDLMASFAIWLPRNSREQSQVGDVINLSGMTDVEKESYIIHNAIPFLTLIHLPGHIALYIGAKDHKAYIYHAVWHFHKSVITPLNLSKKGGASLLSRVDCMNTLVHRDDLIYEKKNF